MVIVHLITFLDSQTGGMERQALQLASRLKLKGYNAFFVTCIHWDKMKREKLGFRGSINGVMVYRVPLIRSLRLINAALYFMGAIFYLSIFKNRYSFIHAHQLYTSGLIACVAKLFLPSKKVIIKNCTGGEYGDINELKKLPYQKWIIKVMLKLTDAFVAVSDETAREMIRAEIRNVNCISNGVDTEMFVPIDRTAKSLLRKKMLGDLAGKTILLFVGRLEGQKNLYVLIDAVTMLKEDVSLLIVGEGSIRKDLEMYVKRKNIQDKVVFCGTTDKMREIYQVSDLFILPSRSEGVPNALLEAMSCGLPCIGSDIGGIRTIIKDKYSGYLFHKDDSEELAVVIKRLLHDKGVAESFSYAARKTIEESYSFNSITEKYDTLYRNILS